ncbi:hypothetical protein GCM10023177_34240 [Streptomyces violaceoruber]
MQPAEQVLEHRTQTCRDTACDTASEARRDQAAVCADRGGGLGIACAHECLSGSVSVCGRSHSKTLGTG